MDRKERSRSIEAHGGYEVEPSDGVAVEIREDLSLGIYTYER